MNVHKRAQTQANVSIHRWLCQLSEVLAIVGKFHGA